ncbi:MAG: hypothetical protein HYY67_01860 [Thaumarchaeota archaeon]|nr:hypothetical protein [Nitrososphaerota archaeon]
MATFLFLNIAESVQKTILKTHGFPTTDSQQPTVVSPSEISIGPPTVILSRSETTEIDYVPERYLMRLNTNLADLRDSFQKVCKAFEAFHYSFSDVARYFEVNIPNHPIEIPNLVKTVRKEVSLGKFGEIKRVFGEELGVYNFGISNLETPLNDKWLSLQFTPDHNSPNNRLLFRLTKRLGSVDEVDTFLTSLEERIDQVIRLFMS